MLTRDGRADLSPWLRGLFPRVQLTEQAFDARHRVLAISLRVHLAIVVAVCTWYSFTNWAPDRMDAMHPVTGGTTWFSVNEHVVMAWAILLPAIVCTAVLPFARSRRSKAVVTTVGLLLAGAALVHASGGQTDMHFDFFVIVALVSLYQDWVPFAVALAVVAGHHVVFSLLDPDMVFSGPQAQQHPLVYTALHVGFILAMAAIQVAYWRLTSQADEALRASMEEASMMSLAARHTDNGVVLATPDGTIEWVNTAFTKMTGYSLSEARGRPRLELFHGPAGEPERLAEVFADVLHGVDAELLTRDRAGREFWLNLQVRPIVEHGQITRFVGIEQDVTERRVAEEQERAAQRRVAALADALEAEKSLLGGVISAIPQLVYWKDAAGRYAGANEAFLSWHGQLARSELVGTIRVDPTLGGELTTTLGEIEADVLATGWPVVDRHVSVIDRDGETRSLLISVLPMCDANDMPDGLIGVGADVSRVSELEQRLSQTHRLESVGQLAAGIAHEINTPVQFVSDNTRFVADSFKSLLPGLQLAAEAATAAGSLHEGDVAARLRASLRDVDLPFLAHEVPAALAESMEGLDRVASIVRAMKDFSHPGMASAEADLNQAVQTTVQVSRNEWRYTAEVELELDPALGLVPCHQGEIKQALLNMIVNACHAIQARRDKDGRQDLGTISITTRRLSTSVQIAIGDDGIGMDPATAKRVFNPFFTTKGIGQGTGQGLSLAHASIVTKHGGTLSVESAPGVGTTFTITLPLEASGPDEPREQGRDARLQEVG